MDERPLREQAVRAVAPGGTRLVVGHASVALWSWDPHVELPSARQVSEGLAVGHTQEWQVVVHHDRTREAIGAQGEHASVITDGVVRLTRAACAGPPRSATTTRPDHSSTPESTT